MESIDRLRKYVAEHTDYSEQYGVYCTTIINDLIDAIEREVEEGYVELPKDADGEYIRIGDEVETTNFGTVEVEGFVHRAVAFYNYSEQPAYLCTAPANLCRHHHAPTVEDVLEYALNKAANLDRKEGYWPSAADITNIINEIAPKLQLREGD